jgi:4-oxalocrotonate tautomerase
LRASPAPRGGIIFQDRHETVYRAVTKAAGAAGRGRYSGALKSAHEGGIAMPEVVVYALGGRSQDQKKGLMKDITEAVVKNYSVPADAVVVTLVETEKQSKMKGGVLFSEMQAR